MKNKIDDSKIYRTLNDNSLILNIFILSVIKIIYYFYKAQKVFDYL